MIRILKELEIARKAAFASCFGEPKGVKSSMLSKLFVVITSLVLPFVFAVSLVFGQTPTTNQTTNTTNTTADVDTDGTIVPTGAPRTGMGGTH